MAGGWGGGGQRSPQTNTAAFNSPLSLPPPQLLPVLEATDDLLDEDDLVCDGLVPLDLQQHVMVILEQDRNYEKTTHPTDTNLADPHLKDNHMKTNSNDL